LHRKPPKKPTISIKKKNKGDKHTNGEINKELKINTKRKPLKGGSGEKRKGNV